MIGCGDIHPDGGGFSTKSSGVPLLIFWSSSNESTSYYPSHGHWSFHASLGCGTNFGGTGLDA
ncbi:hypothetical protein HDG40_000717 [Paraburkholderia sp. JPY158]|uniref:Uncharacterized protein n=2 Tax=Paraburkholderia TaxID=1822464 RepID=A0A7W8L2Z1_9BURK|nr:hypothetical protein [Paraburkholderia youngii]MBB5415759.1 hypothetical protein [Paraburkholderia atlantica]MBB5422576.1 hypothetical protein [Paraburkholderia atlantica]